MAYRIGYMAYLLALTGCIAVIPPLERPSLDRYVAAPFDTVWQRAVGFFADNRLSIETIDKSSGLIVSTGFRLTNTQTLAWVDCGTAQTGGAATEMFMRQAVLAHGVADFNVFVRPTQDSTAVRVNMGASVLVNSAAGPVTHRCASNGEFEKAMHEQVSGRTFSNPVALRPADGPLTIVDPTDGRRWTLDRQPGSAFRNASLRFTASDGEIRDHFPFDPIWRTLPDADLLALMRRARVVQARRPPPHG